MEDDCVAGLYRSVGRSVGEPFSTEDVKDLFCKVFHEPSNTDEVHAAMMKISDHDSSWTCAGDNILDVLREMEQERVKKEKFYWDRQLINAVNYHSSPDVMDTPMISDPYTVHRKGHDEDMFKTQNQMHLSLNFNIKKSKVAEWSVRKLRKAHRQSWARLVLEGLQSLLPTSCPRQTQKPSGQAWGCLTLSDMLLLVEVKYDVVSQLLYTEMLQEHYSLSVWESLSPWQLRKAEEGMEDLADEALESGDLLHLAELPGAFKIYRFHEKSWSAVSFMCELDKLCQREKTTLQDLSQRLNTENLRLLCLYIRLATLRAQREQQSHSALLAAQQSWETWPDVSGPQRAEQAALLLQTTDNEQRVEAVPETPQQAVLQLLLLTQEQERRQLIKLVQGVSLGEVQGLGCTPENTVKQAGLRDGCIKRLQQIYSNLKTHCEPQLEDCRLHLLVHLLKLQEVQTSVLLPTLVDKGTKALQSMQEEYRCALHAQSLPNLLHLLTSDEPLESCSTFIHNSMQAPSTSNDENTMNSKSNQDQNSNTGQDLQPSDSSEGTSDVTRTQAASAANEPDVCTGCGAAMMGLPYLEVLSAPDNAQSEQAKGDTTSATPEVFEKQESLIALAWSKPLDTDSSEEGVDGSPLEPKDTTKTNIEQTMCDTSGGGQMAKPLNEDENQVRALVPEDLLTSSSNSSNSEQPIATNETANHVTVAIEDDLNAKETELEKEEDQDKDKNTEIKQETILTDKVCIVEPVSVMERERTMRTLVDMQKKVEQRQQRDRERQLLKVQERLSIIQNRKAEEDPLGLKDRLKLLTHDLPQEDIHQQKAVVKERLEQLRRERSYILQTKRDKNTAGFKELLGPVGLHNTTIEEDID